MAWLETVSFVMIQSLASIAGGFSRAWPGHQATAARGADGEFIV